MDPRILNYYNRELQHIREMAAEFGREHRKIAGRLGMDGIEVADPYVERLLEGFAYLSARVQLKIDAEFPNFTQALLQMVYPHYLTPTPSMVVAQFKPDLNEPALATGYAIPRGTMLRSQIGRDDRTACDYRTAHALQLWSLEIKDAKYYGSSAALAAIGVGHGARAGLRLSFGLTAGVQLEQLLVDELPIFLSGAEADPLLATLYEALFANSIGFLVRSTKLRDTAVLRPRDCIQRCGFEDDQALLPYQRRSFQGYRLLHEYFTFPQRFMFVSLRQLASALRALPQGDFEIVVLFNRATPVLEGALSPDNFKLFCTPAINLTEKRADRIHLDGHRPEYQVIADRTRPVDYEIFDVLHADGFGDDSEPETTFEPFYASSEATWHGRQKAFFTLRREPRVLSSRERAQGGRSSYVGSEVYLSLVDANQAPYASNLRQLGLQVICTNRDLPLYIPIGKSATDFMTDLGAPLQAIRCVAGPTRPRASNAHGAFAWRLLSHLSLNYLSLLETSPRDGAAALRELLLLYCDENDLTTQRQIEGVRSIATKPASGRLPATDHVAFVRGLELHLTCDDAAFAGQGVMVLGAVLDEFLRRYVSLNSFTRLVLSTQERGEIMRWPAKLGQRHIL